MMLEIWNFQRQVSQFILGMTINRGITNYIITGFVSYLQCNAKGKMKEQAKQKFGELVDRFRYNLDVYKKSTYNETQVRREFIDPFFEALGWDVSNKQGFAEQYKEVVHEDVIKEDVSPSYQLRRYAWSAKLPLSVVTDFEVLSVFDCQIKPNPTDKTGVGRIAYYNNSNTSLGI